MKRKTDRRLVEDIARTIAAHQVDRTDLETDCRVSPNVGELMAAAMAAAGAYAFTMGGREACETDFLAASGAVFPKSITEAEMVRFNAETMEEIMDEEREFIRYKKIALFFNNRTVKRQGDKN